MIYFAELFGKPVKSSDGHKLGRVTDLYFLGQGQPLVTKLTFINRGKKTRVLIASCKSFNGRLTLEPGYQTTEPSENELSVRKNLLDQQILDLKGNKVVRVNDVVIQEKPYPIIAGVDVGAMGILRWLHLEQFINKYIHLVVLRRPVTSKFLPWDDIQPLQLARGKIVLKHEESKLDKLAPEDLADHLERLSIRNLTRILDLLNDEQEAAVVQNLNLSYQQALFKLLTAEKAAQILTLVDPDEAVDILLTLPTKKREVIKNLLPHQKNAEINYLLSLASTDIGNLLSTEFLTVEPEDTTAKVKEFIRKKTREGSWLSYVYVVNKRKELVGVFNLHELLMQSNDSPVYKYMTPQVVVAHLTTPREIAVNKMVKFRINALPVINEQKELLGIVTMDDLLDEKTRKLI